MAKNHMLDVINDKIRDTWGLEYCLTVLTLHDIFDFTPDDIEKFSEGLNSYLEDYLAHRFKQNDIADIVEEETGINIHGMVWANARKKKEEKK